MQVCIIIPQCVFHMFFFVLELLHHMQQLHQMCFPPSGSLLCRLSKTLDDAEESQNVGCFLSSRGKLPNQTFEKSTSTNLHMFHNRLAVHLCKLHFATPEISSQICCRNSREICMHGEATKNSFFKRSNALTNRFVDTFTSIWHEFLQHNCLLVHSKFIRSLWIRIVSEFVCSIQEFISVVRLTKLPRVPMWRPTLCQTTLTNQTRNQSFEKYAYEII